MLEWTGKPFLYPRAHESWGLIIGRHQYLYDSCGRLESMQPLCREVIQILLKTAYKDPALAMAAYLRQVPESIPGPVTATAGGEHSGG